MAASELNNFAARLGGYNVIVPCQTYRSFLDSGDIHSRVLQAHTICLAPDLSLMQAAKWSYSTYCALVERPMRLDADGGYVVMRHVESGRIRISIEGESSIDHLTLLSKCLLPFLPFIRRRNILLKGL